MAPTVAAPYMPGTYPVTARGGTAGGAPPKSSWGSNASTTFGIPMTRNGPPVSRAGMYPTSRAGNTAKRPGTGNNRAAGYSSAGRPSTSKITAFDPLRNSKAGSPTLGSRGNEFGKQELTPEDQVRAQETNIFQLLKESALGTSQGRPEVGLSKAKEAYKRERGLIRLRIQLGLSNSSTSKNEDDGGTDLTTNTSNHTNLDLTFCVLVNLAYQYARNQMLNESIHTYKTLVQTKTFHQSSGRLRVNMGNLYVEMGQFAMAVKMYQMALDQLSPQTQQDLRVQIMHNLAVAYFKWGKLPNAVTNLELILETMPNHRAGFHLLICYYALGNRDKLHSTFQRLCDIPYPKIESTDDDSMYQQRGGSPNRLQMNRFSSLSLYSTNTTGFGDLVAEDDSLRKLARSVTKTIERHILLAGKLIAKSMTSVDPGFVKPVESSVTQTYTWLIDTVKHSNIYVANELQMAIAVHHLRSNNLAKAVECLKEFNKRVNAENDNVSNGSNFNIPASMASTNLSFIALLEQDYESATQHADTAISRDRYNARAHCNRGTIFYMNQDFQNAKEMYLEAMSLDAECIEASFNLGLTYKQLNQPNEAMQVFDKLHTMLRSSPEVVCNIAELHEQMGNVSESLEWYSVLISLVPTDPKILAKLGDLNTRQGDAVQALHHYMEANRYDPSHMETLAWLAHHHVHLEAYEQAYQLFKKLQVLDVQEIQWPLLAASCLRKSGDYTSALAKYKQVHDKWPESVEALRFLVRIALDVNDKDVAEYQAKLVKLEEKNKSATNLTKARSSGRLGQTSSHGRNQPTTEGGPVLNEKPGLERKSSHLATKNDEEDSDTFHYNVDTMLPS